MNAQPGQRAAVLPSYLLELASPRAEDRYPDRNAQNRHNARDSRTGGGRAGRKKQQALLTRPPSAAQVAMRRADHRGRLHQGRAAEAIVVTIVARDFAKPRRTVGAEVAARRAQAAKLKQQQSNLGHSAAAAAARGAQFAPRSLSGGGGSGSTWSQTRIRDYKLQDGSRMGVLEVSDSQLPTANSQ